MKYYARTLEQQGNKWQWVARYQGESFNTAKTAVSLKSPMAEIYENCKRVYVSFANKEAAK
jgi:hypothetical protein